MDRRQLLYKLMLIAVCGAVGTLARYGTTSALRGFSERFPFGTMAVNLGGCLIIGLLQGLISRPMLIREEYQVAMLVGFLGGYTTFSSFAWETTALLQNAQYVRAAVNMAVNNVAGVALVVIGYGLGHGRL